MSNILQVQRSFLQIPFQKGFLFGLPNLSIPICLDYIFFPFSPSYTLLEVSSPNTMPSEKDSHSHLTEDEHSVSIILEFAEHFLQQDELASVLDQRRSFVPKFPHFCV